MAPGSPHEASVTENVMTAYEFAVNALHWDPKNIILFGRSIGTGMSVLCICTYIFLSVCIADVELLLRIGSACTHSRAHAHALSQVLQ